MPIGAVLMGTQIRTHLGISDVSQYTVFAAGYKNFVKMPQQAGHKERKMLDALFHNRTAHLALVLITLLLSFALALLAVFGSIYQNIAYLVFLPVCFMFFLSGLFGLLVAVDEPREQPRLKRLYSLQLAVLLFAVLLIPLSATFLTEF